MDILTWLIVGLIAGFLASLVMGGVGYGIIGDIIIGVVGAFVGGWLFSALHISTPWAGLPGQILVAFVGAVVLLFVLHLITGSRRRVL
ncbi:MAG: GlsB/YeaQ/YmgE family stress response membrane protein [Anaerolineae bacterium]